MAKTMMAKTMMAKTTTHKDRRKAAVERIRRQIAEGTYEVDFELLAERIAEDVMTVDALPEPHTQSVPDALSRSR